MLRMRPHLPCTRRVLRSVLAATALTLLVPLVGCSESPPAEPPGPDRASCDADACLDRDAYGTPLIYAQTMPAAAYALGYAQAEDHAPAILTMALKATGRLAELGIGEVASDLLVRALHIPDAAEALYPGLSTEVRAFTEAFVAGVNRYLDEHQGEAGLEPFGSYRLTGAAVLALARMANIMKQYQVAMADVARFEPNPADYQGKPCPGYSYGDASAPSQSNAWAATAPITPAGTTLLAGDPHLPWDLDPLDGAADGFFHYEAHLLVAGRRFGGAMPLGVPAFGPSYTDDMAISGTHSGVDTADAYHLEIVDPVALTYRVGSEVRALELRTETVQVAGQSPQSFTFADSVFGPVACLKGSQLVSCGQSFDHAFGLLLSLLDQPGPLGLQYDLLQAGTVDDGVPLLQQQQADELNLVAASRDGHILYHLAGRIPARNPDPSICYAWPLESGDASSLPSWNADGTLVVAPFEDHPLLIDPPSGYLVNNNVVPQAVTPGVEGTSLPWHNGLFPPGAAFDPDKGGPRQRLAREALDAAAPGSFDAAASSALAMNTEVIGWRYFEPLLEQLVQQRPYLEDDPVAAQAIAELLGWDGVVTAESRAVLVFLGWAARLDAVGYSFTDNGAESWLGSPDGQVLDAAEQALVGPDGVIPYLAGAGLDGVPGRDGALVAWGTVHYLELFDGDVRRPLGSGDKFLQTLLMSNASLSAPDWGIGATSGGSSYMMQIAYGPDGMQVRTVKPMGVLGDRDDPRYGKMSDLFASAQYRTVSLPGPTAEAQRLQME